MPDGRGKAARGKGKGPVACHAENDQERSALDGQADRHRTRDVLGERSERNRNTAEQQARIAQKSVSEYQRLLADAVRELDEGNSRPAEAAFRKLIALDPAEPTAYYNLGCLCFNAGRRAEAAPNFVRAAALLPEESVEWANIISLAFDTLVHPACSEVAKPEWWNDKDLKVLSKTAARVTGAANVQPSRRVKGHLLRLQVLAAEPGEYPGWQVGPRSAADLNEAATHAGMAAELSLRSESSASSEMAVSLLSEAARLFHKAADMGVKESDAEAAEAAAQADREAAEAAAQAVVRAEAETKANAAAEALLAEEAAEAVALAAASSAPSKGKAKGKPKGKGKSSGKP